jgi:acetolactate synthase small subunit
MKKKEKMTNLKKSDKKSKKSLNIDADKEILTQEEVRPDFWTIVSPEGLTIQKEFYDYGIIKQSLGTKTFARPFYLPRDGYPRKMQTNWLYSLTSSGEIDVLVDVHKVKKNEALTMLQRQITMLKSNLTFQRKRGNIDQEHDLQTKIHDTETLMAETQFSENDSYLVGVIGMLYGQSEKELDKFSEFVEDEMSGLFFKLASTWSRVKKGFRSALPLGINEINDSLRNMDRRALSTFSPFISGSGKFNGGIPIGNNKITGQKEFFNAFGSEEFRPDNYNAAVFGTSGSGKSLLLKLMIAREMIGMGVHQAIIDVENEFSKLTKRLGGLNLDISEESNIRINPVALNYTDIPLEDDDEELELVDEADDKEIIEKEDGKRFIRFVAIREKVGEVIEFFDIIARGKNLEGQGLDVFERNYLEEAINGVFEKMKFTSHPNSLFENQAKEVDGQIIQSRARKPEPTITDIYNYIIEKFENEKKAERLIAVIKPYLRDGSKPIFDGQTYLGKGVTTELHKARLINFNISKMETGGLREIAYHVILTFLWEHFIKNVENANKKKIVYADEAWQLVDYEATVDFLERMARRSRKRNAGLRIASQDFVRILESRKARGILQNTYTFIFLKQNKIDLKKIKENFDLSAGELGILFGKPDKGEGILRHGKSSVWLRTDPSDEELVFVESNSAVLEELKRKRKLQLQR